jgi:hypothetical protein
MTETIASLIERLNIEREKTVAFFSALTANQWNQTIYTGDSPWTPRNILAHTISAEGEFLRLFRDVQAGGAGAPLGFFADEFNAAEQERLGSLSQQELLSEFLRHRAEMIEWVRGLSTDDLEKTGRHPVLGDIPLWEMIKALTLHAHLHARDIRRFFEVA